MYKQEDILKRFGSSIASARKRKLLTQKEFADNLAISSAYLASIETGRRWPNIVIIYDIADALETTPYNLINGEKDCNEL